MSKNKFIPDCTAKDHWRAPENLKRAISNQITPFGKLYDPCPNNPTRDGLDRFWPRKAFVNPPFSRGRQIKWARACYNNALLRGIESYLLIPLDPSTKVFAFLWEKCPIVYLPNKRIKFVGGKSGSEQPMALYHVSWPKSDIAKKLMNFDGPIFQILRIK